MRLSQAIREGGKGFNQFFGAIYGVGRNGPGGCALAAMGRGMGVRIDSTSQGAEWGMILTGGANGCCEVCNILMPLVELAVHLNDVHRMSFNEIADAIEKFEAPAEVTERLSGHPPMVAAKAVWDFIGAPVQELELVLAGQPPDEAA